MVWRLRYMRTRMGKAQYLSGAKGKATCKEKTTKLWPKAKKGRFWVERRGSWCMPAPQMWRPDFRARVSSTAPTNTSAQKGNSSWKTQWPRSSRFQRDWLKKRWKEQ